MNRERSENIRRARNVKKINSYIAKKKPVWYKHIRKMEENKVVWVVEALADQVRDGVIIWTTQKDNSKKKQALGIYVRRNKKNLKQKY